MIAPKLVASSLNRVWARAILVATVLLVAGCEFPGAEQTALPATPTPAVTRLPPATVTAAATTPRPPTPTARAAVTLSPVTSPEARRLTHAPTPSARAVAEVATVQATAVARAAATRRSAIAVTPGPVTVIVDGTSACTTGLQPMRQYAGNEVVRWTADGAHILFTYNRSVWAVMADGSRLWRLARSWGKPVSDSGYSPGRAATFSVSPDSKEVVYATCAYPPEVPLDTFAFDYELVVVGLDGQAPRRLTRHEALDNYPAWSPGGTRIAFVSGRDVPGLWRHREAGLYTMAADGAGVRRLSADGASVAWQPPAWSPDGRSIAVAVGSWKFGEGDHALYVVPADGAGMVRLADTVSGGSWSPDGTRLAFAQPEGAEVVLYTIAVDGSDARRVTTVRGWQPEYGEPDPRRAWIHTVAWSPDGARLLYACGDRQFCVVTLDGEAVGATPLVGNRAAWSPDGARIAVASRPEPRVYNGIVLYSAAPDGSDRQPLAWPGVGFVAAQAKDEDLATSHAACTAGYVVPAPDGHPGLVHDCEALIAARAALFGELPVNWGSGSPLDLWQGVTITGTPPRVTGLALPDEGLRGTIPPELGALRQLKTLLLSRNRLTGCIPVGLKRVPHNDLHHLGLPDCIPVGLKRVPDNDLEEVGLSDREAGA